MTVDTDDGDVRLTMSREELGNLSFALGFAAGNALRDGERRVFYTCLRMVNALHEGDPDFQPYDIPEEFRT